MIKNPPAMQASGFNPWVGKIPWRRIWQPIPVFLPGESLGTEEPGELQSMVSQRVRHNWATKHSTVISKTSDQSQLKKILQNTKAAAAKSLQSCPTLCDPIDGSPPGSPVPGILRQEHWSGLPFPSPMHESQKWKWSRSVMSDPQWPHGLKPTRLLRPWDFPGRSSGVGCHCLLQNTKAVLLKTAKVPKTRKV